jgi:hypothetical protein
LQQKIISAAFFMGIIDLSSPDTYDVILFYIGFIILVATILPRFLSNYLITAPIVYLFLAVGVFYFFFSESPFSHIAESPYLGKRLTEPGIIILSEFIHSLSAGLVLKTCATY